ncbi:MAG: nucleoside deaminase [Pirellulaceae bacterium]|jgi:tRNA(Arg) A34 adenosine deaminase TadA|nr:nucleoside deaminase [Pirellulaceae bacterium]
MTDEHCMRLALGACRCGVEAGQSPFAACIASAGQIIACTHNQVWRNTDPTAHAEVQCIRQACTALGTIHLEGCTIYSTTEPCPMCYAAIHWARLTRIVFAARVADAKRYGFNELQISNRTMMRLGGSAIAVVPDFLRDEALAVYEQWLNGGGRVY